MTNKVLQEAVFYENFSTLEVGDMFCFRDDSTVCMKIIGNASINYVVLGNGLVGYAIEDARVHRVKRVTLETE
jgi:hypothetical protein